MVERNRDEWNAARPTGATGGSLSGAGEAATSARSTTPTGSGQMGTASQGQGVQQQAAQVKEQVQEKAGQLKEQVAEQATSRIEGQKEAATGGLNTVAHAIRQTGDQLREHDQGAVAQYIDRAAEQLEGFAGYLSKRDVRELVRDAEGFARREPALFLGGAFTLGLLTARFLKSSGAATQVSEGTWRGQADWYGSAPALPAPSTYRAPAPAPVPPPMTGASTGATGGAVSGGVYRDRPLTSGTTGAATGASTIAGQPASGTGAGATSGTGLGTTSGLSGSAGVSTTPGRSVSDTDVIVGGPPIDDAIVGGPPLDRGRGGQ